MNAVPYTLTAIDDEHGAAEQCEVPVGLFEARRSDGSRWLEGAQRWQLEPATEIAWLWPGKIPTGEVTVIDSLSELEIIGEMWGNEGMFEPPVAQREGDSAQGTQASQARAAPTCRPQWATLISGSGHNELLVGGALSTDPGKRMHPIPPPRGWTFDSIIRVGNNSGGPLLGVACGG